MPFTEDNYEKALISLFEGMGYQYLYGPNIERDYYVPYYDCLLYTSPSPRDRQKSRMPSSA